ncbi:electron transport complex subunit RsxC [Shewanella fidelis]|uniref:Ion-translocating oxidoreductase complex subunit C n=1 Tax=Shewanella fidelis TaxID=173509 RepID=A0AAW8NL76_9GAMM|nr:electron transport complex subunit RsxC [Shewanella fidelis]MDR8524009.1 electron transport complex subunit RsxC [Shewanella fidelis]MDW4810556.1 electron transport complex subunit RsxC [Shewanella fidelis]MDW4814677.1 electron transport complex subunit RsxC [Shewanella fidelis]MDW4818767.1 electron transport complex subunit RsxC [Shewanella fidelis]MDW4823556.1 electron transport complex subunit RsxC [Shewanella fidelis]
MLTLLEQIDKGTLWRSHGGVHPPELKTLSNQTAISQLPLAKHFVLPLTQVGDSALLAVGVNQRVLKGQPLTSGTSFAYCPVHAPTSGTITAIKPMPSNHASGIEVLSCVIEADGLDESVEHHADQGERSNQDILNIIQQAGIAGLGGAAFPTHIKLNPASEIELVIINGIECEPYITSDDRLMQEHSDEILAGVAIIQRLISPKRIIIAIEDNKPEAIEAMQHALNSSSLDNGTTRITSVPTKYPSGGEKQLIQILTGQEVPSGAIPAQLGMLVQNVATAYAINDAVNHGKALTNRVVTVTGLNSKTPGNYWVPIGTPIEHILSTLGFNGNLATDKVIIGGPMMGHNLPDLAAPVLKGTNCVLLPDNTEIADSTAEKPCIRCGECATACPALLLPQQLFWHAKAEEYDKAASFNLHDCIECGCCSYVCPSDIPLVEYYRIAKSAIRTQTEEKRQADFAKQRFEARLQRLEDEKLAREAKAKEAAARRKSSMSNGDKNAVAEAMARIKAKKAAEANSEPAASNDIADKKAQIAAALARAKAKKAAGSNTTPDANTEQTAVSDKKAQVAAAIARAKAKKQATQQQLGSDDKANDSVDEVTEIIAADDKKAKVAAAIARAKAKKQATQQQLGSDDKANDSVDEVTEVTAADDKKTKVAAAIARAKAKKQASQQLAADDQANDSVDAVTEVPAADDKKAKVAAAIARAKAKKQASQQLAADNEANDSVDAVTEVAAADDKKAKVAAAIARAKAKKQASQQLAADDQASDSVDAVTEVAAADDKKAKIAAAVAKAKAKKLSQATVDSIQTEQKQSAEVDDAISTSQGSASELTAEQQKKARIAATIAKAKAKKAQAKLQEKE